MTSQIQQDFVRLHFCVTREQYHLQIEDYLLAGVVSKNFNKGALGAMSESGCGPFAATPIFLKMEA